jgi:hypothetical protein
MTVSTETKLSNEKNTHTLLMTTAEIIQGASKSLSFEGLLMSLSLAPIFTLNHQFLYKRPFSYKHVLFAQYSRLLLDKIYDNYHYLHFLSVFFASDSYSKEVSTYFRMERVNMVTYYWIYILIVLRQRKS